MKHVPARTRRQLVDDAGAPSPAPKWPGLTTAQSLAVASQFGVSMAAGVGLGIVGGQWLDDQLHTGLLFTLIGAFTGLSVGITGIVALFRATLRSSQLEWRDHRGM
jgi:Putative F0F1-ATPase subunit Ca2+/Mg2+ transporter